MEVAQLNFVLALGTVGMQIGSLILIALFLMRKQAEFAGQVEFVGKWGLLIALVLSLSGAVFTLVYSEILGFEPCPLCWWQRVFQYPLVILFGMALWKERYRAAAIDFSIIFSIIGAGFALYHHILQVAPSGTLPCPATGPSCATLTIFEFGYVTFPMMALSLFALLIMLMLFVRVLRDKEY